MSDHGLAIPLRSIGGSLALLVLSLSLCAGVPSASAGASSASAKPGALQVPAPTALPGGGSVTPAVASAVPTVAPFAKPPAPDARMGLEPRPLSQVELIANAITELDVQRAEQLVADQAKESSGLAFQRARLAIYVGDCDSGEAILSGLSPNPEVVRLASLARSCARATAASVVAEDKNAGVWVRFQEGNDRVLMPYLVDVAVRARETMKRDLGVELPRPLRIDLVRDLFSLAAVSGLPLDAAETTGTVAVARWGRVTMLTPRAARHGYPWQDTLAHEVTHLALARGSGDFAPLWLQEGIAKREETRWRSSRPFDDKRNADRIARNALLNGTSVGIDRIGPSIAMLPTPEAAGISYAEVQSFMAYWIRENGVPAFTALLADLRGLGTRDTNPALVSITGYPLSYWIAKWQGHLKELPEVPVELVAGDAARASMPAPQAVRLGDLLREVGEPASASYYLAQALMEAGDKPAVRYRAATASLAQSQPEQAAELLGALGDVAGLHGGWLGLHGLIGSPSGDVAAAALDFELAIAVDPLGESAACEGQVLDGQTSAAAGIPTAVSPVSDPAARWRDASRLPAPTEPNKAQLCAEARRSKYAP